MTYRARKGVYISRVSFAEGRQKEREKAYRQAKEYHNSRPDHRIGHHSSPCILDQYGRVMANQTQADRR